MKSKPNVVTLRGRSTVFLGAIGFDEGEKPWVRVAGPGHRVKRLEAYNCQ